MRKVNVGGWGFKIKSNWQEVSYEEALKLYATKEGNIKERVSILTTPNLPVKVDLSNAQWLALYEIASFITEVPELLPDTLSVKRVEEWEFRQFELVRRAVGEHPTELALTFARIAEVLDMDGENYLEVGAKALEDLDRFIDKFKPFGLFDADEPTAKEQAAGIERLQAFGAYTMVSRIAEKFGKLPEEVERLSAGFVIQEWAHMVESARFEAEMSK